MMHLRRLRIIAALGLAGLACTASAPLPVSASDGTYVVRPNDTLSGIALNFGTTVSALMAANNLKSPNKIIAGQVLIVHPGTDTTSTASAATTQSGAVPTTAAGTIYIVRAGDTLTDISARLGISMDNLAAVNNLPDWCVLTVGQRLVIPAAGTQATASQTQATAPQTGATPPTSSATGQMVAVNQDTVGAILTAQAQAAGVDVSLAKALAWQESGWQMVTAADGGMGVMQLMPDTVDWISTYLLGYRVNPYDPTDNIRAGISMLRYYLRLFNGDVRQSLAAYHQGLTGVRTQGISAQTAHYVANILSLQQRFQG